MQYSKRKIIRFLTLFACFAISLPGLSFAYAEGPVLVAEPDSLNLGNMQQYETKTEFITLRNIGSSDLELKRVTTSCGCTTAELSVNVLAPGDSTQLQVLFETKKYLGPQTKYVRIHSNDPEHPVYNVPVIVFIQPPISTEPQTRRLAFGRLRRGETATQTAQLWTEAVSRLEIQPDRYDTNFFEVEIRQDPDLEPQKATLLVHSKPEIPSGHYREHIFLRSNIPAMPEINFEIFIDVLSDIELNQQRINFRYVEPDQKLVRKIRIWATEPEITFKITGVEVDLPRFTAEIEQDSACQEAFVTVRGQALGLSDPMVTQTKGRVQGLLKIFTDHPTQPELKVQIYYLLKI